jgi:hypothetical protein
MGIAVIPASEASVGSAQLRHSGESHLGGATAWPEGQAVTARARRTAWSADPSRGTRARFACAMQRSQLDCNSESRQHSADGRELRPLRNRPAALGAHIARTDRMRTRWAPHLPLPRVARSDLHACTQREGEGSLKPIPKNTPPPTCVEGGKHPMSCAEFAWLDHQVLLGMGRESSKY